MERLYKKLESYGKSDYYPFHMPGHKTKQGIFSRIFPFERDITEISGFDNLHHAEGILERSTGICTHRFTGQRNASSV